MMIWKLVRMIGFGMLVLFFCAVLFVGYRFFAMGKQSQSMSPSLGVSAGKLTDCPGSPNCVISYPTDTQHHIEPIEGGVTAFETLKAYLDAQPNVTVKSATNTYLHATFESDMFKFVDDLELHLNDDIVHVRSSSRVGHSDLGANRKRVELLRALVSK